MSGTWTEHKDEEGRTYYYNAETNTSRWDKPPSIQSLTQKALDESPWKEYEDDDRKLKYYYNVDTQETTWEIPEEYKILLDRVSAEIQANLTKAAPKEYTTIGMDFRTKEEAQEAFNQVLEDIGVESHWTWEMCVRRGNSHKFYKALKNASDRKEAFMIYLNDLKERDARRNKKQQELDEELLRKLFDNTPDINPLTRYKDILEKFKDDPEFQSTNLLNRRIFFKKYIADLAEKEREEARQLRKRNLAKIKELLTQLPIQSKTSWGEFQDMLKPTFEEDQELKEIDQMDLLIAFEDYITQMDVEAKKLADRHTRESTRRERKAREAFKELLYNLRKRGILSINSIWKELYPVIKDEPAYWNMLGNSGSTPLELFWDELMDMEENYRPDRRLIFDIVKSSNFDFTVDTTLDQFKQYFEREFRKIDPHHVKIAYEEFLHKAESREYEERRYAERKLRKKMDAFRHYLKYLSPSINIDDKWENVRNRCFGPEYDDLDEEKRQLAFEKFIRRLKEKLEFGNDYQKKRRHHSENDDKLDGREGADHKKEHKRRKNHSSSEEEGELMD